MTERSEGIGKHRPLGHAPDTGRPPTERSEVRHGPLVTPPAEEVT
jgi:hypothetical protein